MTPRTTRGRLATEQATTSAETETTEEEQP